MDLVGVDQVDATSDDVLDSLHDLSGPCTFPCRIERLLNKALVDLVGEIVAIFP